MQTLAFLACLFVSAHAAGRFPFIPKPASRGSQTGDDVPSNVRPVAGGGAAGESPGGPINAESRRYAELGDSLIQIVEQLLKPALPSDEDATSQISATVTSMGSSISVTRSAGNSAMTTGFPSEAAGCVSASSKYAACSSSYGVSNVTSNSFNFDLQPYTEQASCLCYSTVDAGTGSANPWLWQPQQFEGWLIGCRSYVRASLPTLSTRTGASTVESTATSAAQSLSGVPDLFAGDARGAISAAAGLCTKAGDVKAASMSSAASESSSAAPSESNPSGGSTSAGVGHQLTGLERVLMVLSLAASGLWMMKHG